MNISRRDSLKVFVGGIVAANAMSCRERPSASTPPSGPIIEWPVIAMAQAVRARQMPSVELVRACLDRISAVNPKLNAVVQLRADAALDEAKNADAAITRGQRVGPLHGVPMTIKDSFDTAGVISTGGTQGRAAFVPATDATVVRKLKEAGAILLGKTNTPEFTLRAETSNIVYGVTNNPYDVRRTPGGSSGGGAAIVASCGSPFDIGSDTGGSIRQPAHFCGIAGIKPTSGRTSRVGHIISFGGAMDGWTQAGPLARSVNDLSLILPLICGGDGTDPGVIEMGWGDPSVVTLKGLRVAYFDDNDVDDVDPAVSAVVRNAVQSLRDVGLDVRNEKPPGIEQSEKLFEAVGLGDGGAWVKRLVEHADTTSLSESIQAWTTQAQPISASEYTAGLEAMDGYRSRMLTFMQSADVIICPVEAFVAPHHGGIEKRGLALTFTLPFNITGQPVVSIRAGTSPDGLPIGVQVVARRWREDVALAVAAHIESTFGGWQRPLI